MPRQKAIKPDHQFPTHSWQVFDIAFSPTQKIFVGGTREKTGGVLIDTERWRILGKLPQLNMCPDGFQFSPDGKSLYCSQGLEDPAFSWAMPGGAMRWSLPKGVCFFCLSADGKTIVAAKAKSVLIIDPATGYILHTLNHHVRNINDVFFSSGAKRIVSTSRNEAFLWNAALRKPICSVQENKSQVNCVAFSRGGLLALGSKDGAVRLYDLRTGAKRDEFEAHEDGVFSTLFTPDGKYLITSGIDRFIHIRNVAAKRFARTIELPEEASPDCLRLYRDGKTLAFCLGFPLHEVNFFNVKTGEFVTKLSINGVVFRGTRNEYRASPGAIAFSPKGDYFAVASNDGVTRFWKTTRVLKRK